MADNFPALKKVVIAGRYSPIPRKYSEGLHRVLAAMLRVSTRERPSAEALLRSPDVCPKLSLDDATMVLQQQQLQMRRTREREQQHMSLMETIKVPQSLRQIALPKSCYPDMRPNSPSAWTVAEQQQQLKQFAKQPAPSAPVAPAAVVTGAISNKNGGERVGGMGGIENRVPETNRERGGGERAMYRERARPPTMVKHTAFAVDSTSANSASVATAAPPPPAVGGVGTHYPPRGLAARAPPPPQPPPAHNNNMNTNNNNNNNGNSNATAGPPPLYTAAPVPTSVYTGLPVPTAVYAGLPVSSMCAPPTSHRPPGSYGARPHHRW